MKTSILTGLRTALIGASVLLPSPSQAAHGRASEKRAPDAPKDALDRRARSNAVMVAEGVPVNKGLPPIEAESEVRQRPVEEVTMRAAATLAVAMKAMGEKEEADAIVREYGLAHAFTPDEKAFIANPAPTDKDRAKFSWRSEAAYVLFWSLGLVDDLPPPRDQCDPSALVDLLRNNSRAQLLAKARNRPMPEILDQADLIYRYRWALVDAEMNNKAPPAGLSNDVAMERHHALNWLIVYEGQAWDDISLDT